MKNLIQRFIREEEGQDLIEYALLTFLIAVGLAVTLGQIGDRVAAIFAAVLDDLTA